MNDRADATAAAHCEDRFDEVAFEPDFVPVFVLLLFFFGVGFGAGVAGSTDEMSVTFGADSVGALCVAVMVFVSRNPGMRA